MIAVKRRIRRMLCRLLFGTELPMAIRLQGIRLEPNDVLVLSTTKGLTVFEKTTIKAEVQHALPGRQGIILDEGLEVHAVVRLSGYCQ